MKKSRKIFGAVALSAVLAFGTAVPAFADNNNMTGEDVSNTTNLAVVNQNSPAGAANTTINIATYSSHYDVTLPLVLPFMLDQQGGAGVAPTGYYIKNKGTEAAVEIWDVTWEMSTGNQGDSNFLYTFGTKTGLGNTDAATNGLTAPATGSGNQAPKYGSFTIEATSSTGATFSTLGKNISQVTTDVNGDTLATAKDGARYGHEAFDKGEWVIAKNDSTGTLAAAHDNITLAISGTKLTNAPEAAISSVASLVYTVGPTRGTN